MSMTEQDKQLVRDAFAHSPTFLIDNGMTREQAAAFLTRPDVVAMLKGLELEMEQQEGLYGRQRFMTKRSLSRLTTKAVKVLEAALADPVYTRDPATGKILFDVKTGVPFRDEPGPDPVQIGVAQDVLDRMGMSGKKNDEFNENAGMTVNVLFDQAIAPVKLSYDEKDSAPEQQAQSRERRRNALARVLPTLVATIEKINQPEALKPSQRLKKNVQSKQVKPGKGKRK
jgi:hypothetical protein